MNKIRVGQTAAVLAAVAASTLTAGAATAAPAATDICTGYGVAYRKDVGDIKNLTTKVTVGYVELCERVDAGQRIRWTNVRLGYTMNPGERGNGAIVYRYIGGSGAEYTDSTCAGGTGQIYAPDRTCSTGASFQTPGAEDRAYAYIYNTNDKIIASGRTLWIR